MSNTGETPKVPTKFDFAAFPPDTLFHDRRSGIDRRAASSASEAPFERRKKERRRRVDPTTFEKQYTRAEIEFMTAMEEFKVQSCKAFPSHRDVLKVAAKLGYRRRTPATMMQQSSDRSV